ncbi:DegV family protein [Mycoplasmopsis lipofaciens]|uniref:DegV family protein n=1 Tax=Mycoplasmopsis lipofaciens TaxID=114884 RepID=UPI00048530EE|nr:DegV family protein [Mycoplasmopsis lipofaciens]
MNYAIVVDSSCGLTKEEAKKLGWYYLPLHISIDGKEFRDGIDVDSSTLFNFYNLKSDVKTSAFNIGEAEQLFNELSKNYEKIVVYPISKHLSGAYQQIKTLANDFPKVVVIESIQVLNMITLECLWFEREMKNNSSKFEEYISWIESGGLNKSATLIPKYNQFLVKGGRLHSSAAVVARMLKIVPIIKWEKGMLVKESLGRVFSKATLKYIGEKSKSFKPKHKGQLLTFYLHSNASEEDKKAYISEFRNKFNQDPIVDYIAPVVSIHTGPEAFACLIFEVDPELKKYIFEKMELIGKKW